MIFRTKLAVSPMGILDAIIRNHQTCHLVLAIVNYCITFAKTTFKDENQLFS